MALPSGAANRASGLLVGVLELLNLLLDLLHNAFGLCRKFCHLIVSEQHVLRKTADIHKRVLAGVTFGTVSNVAGI